MKFLALTLLTLTTTSAFADTTYQCDSYELNAGQYIEGITYSVVTDKGGGADVYATAVVPNAKPTLTYVLDTYSQDGKVFMQTKIQDLSVTFTRSFDEKAGVLKIQGIMPTLNGEVSPAQAYICTK